ncbi:MAG: 3-deoxy-7-phosphoheptulonate synthase [Sphaerochaetaceae bacterium]
MESLFPGFRIQSAERIYSPDQLKSELPLGEEGRDFILNARNQVRSALRGEDRRLIVVVGPCSIHDPDGAFEYALRLKELACKVSDKLLVVMRCYFEKPRTAGGWKGMINDPCMDGSLDIPEGLRRARRFLTRLADMGLPAGTEALDPLTLPYYQDLVSWGCIGARTCESQVHRNMAGMRDMAVGVKNPTSGDLEVAVNSLVSAAGPAGFLCAGMDGHMMAVRTAGNDCCHLILRGTAHESNYTRMHMQRARSLAERAGLRPMIMIDCSHGNSCREPLNQVEVLDSILNQIASGEKSIRGFMLESFLHEGSQEPGNDLRYGVSVTDPCLGWDGTEAVIMKAWQAL